MATHTARPSACGSASRQRLGHRHGRPAGRRARREAVRQRKRRAQAGEAAGTHRDRDGVEPAEIEPGHRLGQPPSRRGVAAPAPTLRRHSTVAATGPGRGRASSGQDAASGPWPRQRMTGFLEGQARAAREQAAPGRRGPRLIRKLDFQPARGEERLVHLRPVEAGHRAAIEPQRARRDDEIGALQRAVAERRLLGEAPRCRRTRRGRRRAETAAAAGRRISGRRRRSRVTGAAIVLSSCPPTAPAAAFPWPPRCARTRSAPARSWPRSAPTSSGR